MGSNSVRFALAPSDSVGLTESQRQAIELQFVLSISNEATWLYKNFRHPRYKNFYGYAQLMSGDFVVENIPLQYINQEILHWQDSSVTILQTVVCGVKLILASLPTPVDITPEIVLFRQRYTGVRFRLLPGIEANVAINWLFIEQSCDETISPPPPEQGNPPAPDNYPAPPGAGRGDQPGDLKAPSNNDGDFNSGDGRPLPPGVGGSLPGFWRLNYQYGAPLNRNDFLQVAGAATDVVSFSRVGPLSGCTADRYRLRNETRDLSVFDDNCVTPSMGASAPVYISNV